MSDTSIDYDFLVEHLASELDYRIKAIHGTGGTEGLLQSQIIRELCTALRILTDSPYEGIEAGDDNPE